MSYYQATHFNSNVTINDTKVGGMRMSNTEIKNIWTSKQSLY